MEPTPETELGRTLQELRRQVSEAQAEIENVREAVAELMVSLGAHMQEHERSRRSSFVEFLFPGRKSW